MRDLPKLRNVKNKTKKYSYIFGGINKGESFAAGELEDSVNISFDSYPALSAGRKRENAASAFEKTNVYLPVEGGALGFRMVKLDGINNLNIRYIDEKDPTVSKSAGYFENKEIIERTAASFGKHIVLFPDKLYCDKERSTFFSEMEKFFETTEDGQARILAKGAIQIVDSELFRSFRNKFSVGDVVTIDGGWWYGNATGGTLDNAKLIIREIDISAKTIYFDPNCFDLQNNDMEMFETTFKKVVPELKMVTGYEGRVWGFDAEGKIYASKYKDPTNFEYFDFSSADSYTIETDTSGDFTAVCGAEGHIAFFKEDKIHRITGTKPSNFRHTVIHTNGVKKGAEKTVCSKNGLIYYMGTDGIYVYGGAEARRISDELGQLDYQSGAAVFYKDVYYISIKSSDGTTALYGYDTKKGLWLKDGDEYFKTAFIFLQMPHYQKEDGTVKVLKDGKDDTRDASVTLRSIRESDSEQKGWSRLYINAKLEKGDTLKAEVDYGAGFETAGVFTDSKKTVFEVRLAPNRADEIKLRLTFGAKSIVTKLMREHYVHGSVF